MLRAAVQCTQAGPTTERSMGQGLRTPVWRSALQENLDTYPLSPGAIRAHLCPPPTFASFHLPLLPSGFTHPHACTHALGSRDSHASGFSHALAHTEKSGKSVPRLIELRDWGLAGHCVSELQLLAAVSALDRMVQAPCESSCCCSSPLPPSPTFQARGLGRARPATQGSSSLLSLLCFVVLRVGGWGLLKNRYPPHWRPENCLEHGADWPRPVPYSIFCCPCMGWEVEGAADLEKGCTSWLSLKPSSSA